MAEVARDDIPLARCRSSDENRVGSGDPEAVAHVRDRPGAGRVRADEVSPEDRPVGAGVGLNALAEMAGDEISGDHRSGRPREDPEVTRNRGRALGIGSDEVALDEVSAAGPFDVDAHRLSGDDVALGRRRAADAIVGRRHRDSRDAVAVRDRSRRIHTDAAALHDPAATRKPDAIEAEPPDGQAAHDRSRRGHVQTDRSRAGGRAVELDERKTVEPRLRGPVDRERIRNDRERRRGRDRRAAAAREIENDGVGAGQRVGVQDRLAQRPRSESAEVVTGNVAASAAPGRRAAASSEERMPITGADYRRARPRRPAGSHSLPRLARDVLRETETC